MQILNICLCIWHIKLVTHYQCILAEFCRSSSYNPECEQQTEAEHLPLTSYFICSEGRAKKRENPWLCLAAIWVQCQDRTHEALSNEIGRKTDRQTDRSKQSPVLLELKRWRYHISLIQNLSLVIIHIKWLTTNCNSISRPSSDLCRHTNSFSQTHNLK